MTKEANQYMKDFKSGLVGGLNTCLIGQIDEYDPITNKANVILLPDGDLIIDVPVAAIQTDDFFIRMPYQPGDHVAVVFSQRDIDGIMHENDATPTDRMLSMDDAIVLMGLNLFNDPLPAEDADKLVIGTKDGSTKIVMGDGKISLIGNVDVNGTPLGSGGGTV